MLVTKNYRAKSIWSCDVCQNHFPISNPRIPEAKHHFCSKQCRKQWAIEQDSKRVVNWVKTNGSPNFRGGIGITTDGYVWVLIRGHGYPYNQIKLHRYLMQVKLGRELRSDEIVHHINGDKLDNRIENLEITTISEHNRKHGHLRAENRDDTWSKEELSLLLTGISAEDFRKTYPQRTKQAVYQMRSRLRRRNAKKVSLPKV